MTNKSRLLICVPDFPFPARKNGVSIRYAPILTDLSQYYDIHLICISSGTPIEADLALAQNLFRTIDIYTRKKTAIPLITKLWRRIAALNFLKPNTPFNYLCYDAEHIETFIRSKTSGTTYDSVICVLANYASIVKKTVNAKNYALDFIDSPFATAQRSSLRNPLALWDLYIIKKWEKNLIQEYDKVSYVSPLDKTIGAGDLTHLAKVSLIPNGLYLEDLTDEKITYPTKTIGYLGNMSYPPNIQAAKRLFKIFSENAEKIPNTSLVIIGRDPTPEIQRLAETPGVIVTGSVENIWQFINGIDIFVFPMEIGSGQQNKILEAMGAGKIVITTNLGNSGIGATPLQEIIIADNDSEIIDSISKTLLDPRKYSCINQSAKAFIESNYNWPEIIATFKKRMIG
ncbi:glycosyltransferase [Cellvibrio sp. NN19]|uniref:glycosyltransferase n=1 Tax=Cellvibrio chitinivorans TaxID=3102792 RepID=UPI002B412965|nr:glycosyltransferase [Cellvibrio sp. NN19]